MIEPADLLRMKAIVSECRFRDWELIVCASADNTHAILQIRAVEPPAAPSFAPYKWTSRKWRLSPFMTKSEIVQTALLAVLTAVEHETRETFTYKGRAVFGPHFDVEKLFDLCGGADAVEMRA